MSADADLIVIGGGCAGLSLAIRLGGRGPRTLVLDARERYEHDRTWCFWDDGSAALHGLVAHSWPAVTVRAGPVAATLDCGMTPYRMLPAGAFYAEALGRVRIEYPVRVVAPPSKLDGLWRIETTDGPRAAPIIVDTRPRTPARGGAVLWQSFAGREVECAGPAFDPTRAELMDFAPPDPRRVAFTYVLPMSPTRALIEWTVFGPDPLDRHALAAELDAAVALRTGGGPVATLHEESGILPMGVARHPADRDPSYVRAGLFSGAARPSTGYAFGRIQRWAELCAGALIAGGPPLPHPADPPLLAAMDRILLAVVRADPAGAPALFARLFAQADPARVIRFLSDRGTFADYVAISWVLPTLPFLRRLPSAVSNRRLLAA